MAMVKERLDHLNHAEFTWPGFVPSAADRRIMEIRARHNIVAFVCGSNDRPSRMNRTHPVPTRSWLREELAPVAVQRLRHRSFCASSTRPVPVVARDGYAAASSAGSPEVPRSKDRRKRRGHRWASPAATSRSATSAAKSASRVRDRRTADGCTVGTHAGGSASDSRSVGHGTAVPRVAPTRKVGP
jgi:hypothetical protein